MVGVGIDLEAHMSARPNEALARELGLEGHPVVGIVAKLSSVKGHDRFLRAAADVARSREDVRFLVVGEGSRRAELVRIAGDLGISGSIHFVGARDDVPSLLRLMDVFVLSSSSEGSPQAVAEAMAAGVAVVAPRVGGVPDMVEDGSSGLLVEPGDASATAGAVLEILSDPARGDQMGRRGRELARERYDIEGVVVEIERILAALLGAARTRTRGAGRGEAALDLGIPGGGGRGQ
jgi:glycosyltransferase involved in cell wall biosynthesis